MVFGWIPAANLYNNIRRKYNNDRIDRLNHLYSAGGLITFAFIFLFGAIFDRTVICLPNAYEHFRWAKWYHENKFVEYANSYCYIESKYFIPLNQSSFPTNLDTRKTISIDFYPWVVVIFITQAIFFALPHWIWESFNAKTGIALRSIAISLTATEAKGTKLYGKQPRYLYWNMNKTPYFLETLKYNSDRNDRVYGCISPRQFLSKLYLFYKFANIVNVLAQLLFLKHYLIHRYTFFGASIIWEIASGSDWTITGNFPRLIYCDFMRRDDSTGKPFLATSQCLLPYNMLYEFMFGLIWAWLAALLILNILSFIEALTFVYSYRRRASFVKTMLLRREVSFSRASLRRFVENILEKDGVITLRILNANLPYYKVTGFAQSLFTASNRNFPAPPTDEQKEFEMV